MATKTEGEREFRIRPRRPRHLVGHRNNLSSDVHNLHCQLKAQIHPLRTNMEEDVSRCRDRMTPSLERISRNGCSSAGRGAPKTRFHASDPNAATQVSPAFPSRNSTDRIKSERPPQNLRTCAYACSSCRMHKTRKIPARVSDVMYRGPYRFSINSRPGAVFFIPARKGGGGWYRPR